MLRALVYGLAILHLGPGIAFAALAFGCDPAQPLLGALCERSGFGTFLQITAVAWVLLGAGAFVHWWLGQRRAARP